MRFLLFSMLAGLVWAQPPASPAKPSLIRPGTPGPQAGAPSAQVAAPAPQALPPLPAETVVLEVGGKKFTRAEFDEFMQSLPANTKAQLGGDGPQGRRRVAQQLSELLALAEEAQRQKMGEKPAVRWQLYLQSQSVLANALAQNLMETGKPSDADAKAYYDSHKNEYESIKARHVLIRFQGSRVPLRSGQKDLTDPEALAKAQEVRARIAKGEDFAAVAKAESDDSGSGAQGGDLGTFQRGRMVPAFEQAAFSLPVNEVSQPVKTPFGYHIIQVQEKTATPFEGVRAQIDQKLVNESMQKQMDTIKAGAKPSLNEGYFGPPIAVAAPMAPAAPAPAPAPAK